MHWRRRVRDRFVHEASPNYVRPATARTLAPARVEELVRDILRAPTRVELAGLATTIAREHCATPSTRMANATALNELQAALARRWVELESRGA